MSDEKTERTLFDPYKLGYELGYAQGRMDALNGRPYDNRTVTEKYVKPSGPADPAPHSPRA